MTNKNELVTSLTTYPSDAEGMEGSSVYAGQAADILLPMQQQILDLQVQVADMKLDLKAATLVAAAAPQVSTGSISPQDAIYLFAEIKKILLGEEEA